MSEFFNYCHVVGCTDVGRQRAANEDRMSNAITQNGLVAIVCDGMGGHVGGATASRIAVESIIDHLNKVYYDDPRLAIGESIDVANRAILQDAEEHPELAGMGSTCVMLLVRGGKVYIGHVGDSRIYLVRSKRIVQLTKDHSYVQMLVDSGEITKEQAEKHPRKNEITNALGIPNMSPATVADDAYIPEAGDCFILCSDGLSGMVHDAEICKIVSKQTEMNAQERVEKLVSLANANGGVDNITVQLVEFSVSPSSVSANKDKPTWFKITFPIFILLLISIGAYFFFQNKQADADIDISPIQELYVRTVSKTDTLYRNLIDVEYKKQGRIIELFFEKNRLSFICNKDTVFTDYTDYNKEFIPSSLTTNCSSNEVKQEFDNRLLSFGDKKPYKDITISILNSDTSKVYFYTIKVKDPQNNSRNHSNAGSNANSSGKPATDDVSIQLPKEETKKDTTISVTFECDSLLKNDALVVVTESSIIKISFRKTEKIIDCKEGKLDNNYTVVNNDLYWKAEYNGNNQIKFKFGEEKQLFNKAYRFETAVKKKNGTIIRIIIDLKGIGIAKTNDNKEEEQIPASGEESYSTEEPVVGNPSLS